MSPSDITVIMTSVTALAAIVAPVITAIYSGKTQERMKRTELYSPRVYDALADMSKAYSQLSRGTDATDDVTKVHKNAMIVYYEFSCTAYKVMSLIPKEGIQNQISNLLTEIENYSYFPSELHDELFRQLMRDITKFLQKSRKKPI